MRLVKKVILATFLTGSLILTGSVPTAQAHGFGRGHGKDKHHFCFDKHGRWRSHPHCPPPRRYSHHHGRHDHRHELRRVARHRAHRFDVIHVRKDRPFDRRHNPNSGILEHRHKAVIDAHKEVLQSRERLQRDLAELKNDRAALRRDIRRGATQEEIRRHREEIRADLAKIKASRQELRQDRAQLENARRDLRNDLARR